MTNHEPAHDPRFDRRYDANSRHPLGRYPIPEGSGLRAVECVHCHGQLGISKWDYWNGFLVKCPHCSGFHGKPWGIERTVVAGLILNVLSFPFVFRPRMAFAAIFFFVLTGWLLGILVAQNDTNTALMIAFIGIIGLGPVVINAIALVRHQVQLDRSPPVEGRGA